MKLEQEEAWAIQSIYKWHDVDNTRSTILLILDAIGVKYEVSGNIMSIKILQESISNETNYNNYD